MAVDYAKWIAVVTKGHDEERADHKRERMWMVRCMVTGEEFQLAGHRAKLTIEWLDEAPSPQMLAFLSEKADA